MSDSPKKPDLKVIDGYYAASVPPPPTYWQKYSPIYAWTIVVIGALCTLWFGGGIMLIGALIVWAVVKAYELITRRAAR